MDNSAGIVMEKSLADLFKHSVEVDLVSADLFELELETELITRIQWANELFAGRPEFLLELKDLDLQAASLENLLGAAERWELCARVRDLRLRYLPKVINIHPSK
jgi:hypothetical protein